MTNPHDEEREERALDALIVAALRADLGDVPSPPEQGFPELTEEDRRALDALGPDFIKRLLEGQIAPTRSVERTRERRERASAMHRGDEDGEVTDRAREEMERKVKDHEARKEPNRGDQE
jgi:hypothetical protein